MLVRMILWVLVSLVFSSTALAETHRFKPTKGFNTYAVREPVLRIRPGDIVETSTLFSDFFTERDGPWPGEVGPIYIEGAMPNDTLVVKIIRLRPNIETGRSGTSFAEDYGVLNATNFTPMLNDPVPKLRHIWKLDLKRMKGTLDLPKSRLKSIEVDLKPLMGRLATAPSGDQAIAGGFPGDFGGNMDTSDAREGVTLHLPIFHEGAYFYWGDGHALQGDGEITGLGIETAMDVTFQFDLIKNKKIAWPRFEDEEYIMVAGSVRPLLDAFRIAHVEMIKWLENEYGFDRWEALEVFSQVGVARVANVVDPNFTVMAKFPKKFLPRF